MPLTAKGTEILANMRKEYGEKRGEEIFYASKNAHKITGVDSEEGAVVELRKAIEAGELESEAEEEATEAGKLESQHQKAALSELTKDEKCCPNGDVSAIAQDKREIDSNGWFEIKNNPISKAGVFQYSEAAILKGGDRNKMINVFLPPEELGSEETIKSFRLLPWTDDHPEALLGKREDGLVPADEKGIRGVIGQDIHFDNDTLYANVKVFSESLAKKIADGKRELSCGYRCDFIPQDGFYQGKPYQYVQRNVRGNHQASVDRGRRGPDVRVLDAAERFTFSLDMSEEKVMAEKRKDEAEGTVDAETLEHIKRSVSDSFNSLVSELERKGYSKEYATKIAGKVANEKRANGDSKDTTSEGTTVADSTKGDVKDPEGKDDPSKKDDLKPGDAKDRKAARDAKRAARDTRRGMDSMSAEEEEAEDACEAAEDAEEEKEDEKDESKEARDRKAARDRRHGARDARKHARDRAKAKDAAKDTKKGMDAAEVAALVDQRVRDVAPAMRREAAAVHKLYQRLSPIIGAFDHDEMSVTEMATYGLKKLGAPEAKTDPVTALDFYLAGRTQTPPEPRVRSAQDSDDSFVGKYLNS